MIRWNGMARAAVLAGAWVAAGLLRPDAVVAQTADEEADEPADMGEVTVTGSRIRRDEFTSAAPLQIFDVEGAKRAGIMTVAELLQRSSIANGRQIDNTLNTNAGASNASEPPPLGGVGSANISLRALEPERTLILINGRRLGSSGVRGAPAQPDINLLPLNIVERVEVITEGASSVYGADAVAGVVNVILKDNYEGLEFTVNAEQPADSGGEVEQFSFLAGTTSDRGKFMLSGEYFDRERLSVGEREPCLRKIEVTADGQVFNPCRNGFFDNSVLDLTGLNPLGDIFLWYTPGQSDTGIPNFSSAANLAPPADPQAADDRADLRNRFVFDPFYNDTDERLAADLVQPIQRFSVLSLGSYAPGWFGVEDEVYYEASYFNRELLNIASTEQIFPSVPGMIPQEDANGNVVVDAAGNPVLVDNPFSPFPDTATPIYTLDDLPQRREVELQHFRMVTGLRGFVDAGWFGRHNIGYDVFASYDRGTGFQSQLLLNETNLILALETLRLDAGGNPVCGVPTRNNQIGFLTPQPCVPVNFFAPSLFTGGPSGEGAFATAAERDFLIGTRTNRTVTEQVMGAAYLTGDIAEIPSGGTVAFATGIEFRDDKINSAVDYLGGNGLVAAENPLQEGPTIGRRNIKDVYGEVSVPLLVGRQGADLLQIEGALRYTDESNFGSETTGRARLTWRPVDWVSLSSSYGTSFRAPNLREQFLADQFQSVGGDSDPCVVPVDANVGGMYVAANDTRSQTVLDNCVQSGADPTMLGLQATTTIPVTVGGNPMDLDPETSDAFTATVQLSPPLGENWDFDIAVSYFDIEIEDTVRSIGATTIMSRCFEDAPNLESPFCDRIRRGQAGAPLFNVINFVDASFVNVGQETSKGIDVNTRLARSVDLFGAPVEFGWLTATTFQTDRTEQIFEGGMSDDLRGNFGIADTRLTSTVTARLNNWEALWIARYQSGTEAGREARLDADCGVFDDDLDLAGTVETTPLCSADSAVYHDFAATYLRDTWAVSFGINNAFDEEPPLVNIGVGSNRANRITSSGYDQFGRSYFLTLTKTL
ncbi:TonB-dependent receptor [soil metagenome]